ncbi:MAG: phosphoribosylamine--glycine ligase [Thermoplasmata archaeon]|nr:phosphoribosylamine--glycine ligase [Thermoplasmata archaeon]
MRVLLVGGGSREHAIGSVLHRAEAKLLVASKNANPGLEKLATASRRLDPTDAVGISNWAKAERADYAVIGPEAALSAGVADALEGVQVPCAGPTKAAAQVETSKRFCRELLQRNGITETPRFVFAQSQSQVDDAVKGFSTPFVVKPAGLTAGKGVWVQGVDFETAEDGAKYAKQFLTGAGGVVFEEKVEGEEFSQMAFVTDSGVYPMPAVQDYKRAGEGDTGANTGGMGSYSQRDHLLPFLPNSAREKAVDILRRSVAALRREGLRYRGVLYGGFMQTAVGPTLLEFNARFGDPEGINAMTLYEDGDMDELLFGVATGRVDPNLVQFRLRSTVVKYLVPPGYPGSPKAGGQLQVDEPAIEALGVHVYFGSVDTAGPGRMTLSTSRSIALAGEASAIWEAGERVESALAHVKGDYQVRHDIATKSDLSKRWEHMRKLIAPQAKSSPLPLSVAAADAPASSLGDASQVIG